MDNIDYVSFDDVLYNENRRPWATQTDESQDDGDKIMAIFSMLVSDVLHKNHRFLACHYFWVRKNAKFIEMHHELELMKKHYEKDNLLIEKLLITEVGDVKRIMENYPVIDLILPAHSGKMLTKIVGKDVILRALRVNDVGQSYQYTAELTVNGVYIKVRVFLLIKQIEGGDTNIVNTVLNMIADKIKAGEYEVPADDADASSLFPIE